MDDAREANKRREIRDSLVSLEKRIVHLVIENKFVLGQMGATDDELDTLRDGLIVTMTIQKRIKDRQKTGDENIPPGP